MTEYAQLIINDINNGLTGNYEEDMMYLHKASEKYKNDEESADILREIANIMYEILPENQKSELSNRFEQMKNEVAEEFKVVKNLIESGDYTKAKISMEAILTAVDGSYEENEDSIYMCFNHVIELYIFNYYYKPVKEVKSTDIPYHEFYRTYAYILTNLKSYEEAIEALNKANIWNPVDLDTLLSLTEVYKQKNDLENFLKITKQVYKLCCTRATMARYYRNLAYYYVETYKPEIARALYVYSNIYFPTENAEKELAYIDQATNSKAPEYTLVLLQQVLKENDIELGPDSNTIGIIYRVGQIMMQDGDNARAKDCFTIVYDITNDQEAKELLERL